MAVCCKPTTLRYIMFRPATTLWPTVSVSTRALSSQALLAKDVILAPTSSNQYLAAVNIKQIRGLADKQKVDENLEKYRKGNFETIPNPQELPHFRTLKPEEAEDMAATEKKDEVTKTGSKEMPPIGTYVLPHPIWTETQVNQVKVTHKEPEGLADRLAYRTVKLFRGGFDLFSGFSLGQRTERKWLNRICFLETVAGVPGMVAAMMRHMTSLRRMQRDQGWIHTLLEEAENERMHLLTALQLREPSLFFRLCVIGAQGVFVTLFGLSYAINAKFCHRFVGYLEEEAVKTYTKCLEDIDHGPMKHWQTQAAPEVAIRYWKMKPDSTMRDVILAIRADEDHHRLVNHSLASLKKDEFNPHKPGE
ncbi:Alternative oxidase, mitochondrial [Plakobranchus ocellatus]|uniref:Alternative oxidase, mitochondrial n=1 Tax=Plakobranchus ocellatus TaxID=259542 RepID=A0AAV3ZJ16_9GAST|nr:Alternative oxidase, mitochondrial [Plakobranchus ocellatus]